MENNEKIIGSPYNSVEYYPPGVHNTIPYVATLKFDHETRVIKGTIKMGYDERSYDEAKEFSYLDKVKEKITPTSTKLVVEDMIQRETFGYNKYGKYLSVNTDEDMIQHLYEELLDGAVYIRTLIEQRRKHNGI